MRPPDIDCPVVFRSSLNTDIHFHICVVNGVFAAVAGDDDGSEVKFRALAYLKVRNESKRRMHHMELFRDAMQRNR